MVHQSFLRRRSGWGSRFTFPHRGKTYQKTVLNDLSRKYWMPCYNRRRSLSMSNKFQHPTRIWNTTTAIDTKTFLPNSANLSGSISHGNLFSNSDMETLNELKKVSDELNLCVKQNAVEVKAKLVELLQEDEEKKAISCFERESLDLKRKKLERLNGMMKSMVNG